MRSGKLFEKLCTLDLFPQYVLLARIYSLLKVYTYFTHDFELHEARLSGEIVIGNAFFAIRIY